MSISVMANFIFVYCHLFCVSFSRARISFRSVLPLGLFLLIMQQSTQHQYNNSTTQQLQQQPHNTTVTTTTTWTWPVNRVKVTGFCRSPQETRKSSPTGSVTSSVSTTALTPSRQLTDAEKLRKVVMELVDTERTYVKVSLHSEKMHIWYL